MVRGAGEEMIRIAAKYGAKPRSKMFNKAFERFELMISGTAEGLELLSPDNKSLMIAKNIQDICKRTGAELGKDLSIVDGGVLVKGEFVQTFLGSMTPEELARIEASGCEERKPQDPFKMLEDSLGIPFFASLEAVVKLRLQTLTDARSAIYLTKLYGGLQNKHSWLASDWVGRFLRNVCGERLDSILSTDDLSGGDNILLSTLFNDLLTALGMSNTSVHPEHGRTFNRDEILALDKVFRGTEQSYAEIAETMRRVGAQVSFKWE
jgi:hypothetical protein